MPATPWRRSTDCSAARTWPVGAAGGGWRNCSSRAWPGGRRGAPPNHLRRRGRRTRPARKRRDSRHCANACGRRRRSRARVWYSPRRERRCWRACRSEPTPTSARTSFVRIGCFSVCAPDSGAMTRAEGTRTWISSLSKWRSTGSVGFGTRVRMSIPRVRACGTPTGRVRRTSCPTCSKGNRRCGGAASSISVWTFRCARWRPAPPAPRWTSCWREPGSARC